MVRFWRLLLVIALAVPVYGYDLNDRATAVRVASMRPMLRPLFQVIGPSGGGGGGVTAGTTTTSGCTDTAILYSSSSIVQCNGFLESLAAGTWTLATAVGTNGIFLATAPAATTGASQAGKTLALTASAAVASTDTAGAAAGGAITLTGGAAARNASGNANGGNIALVGGAGIGTGTQGFIDASNSLGISVPAGTNTNPSLFDTASSNTGFYFPATTSSVLSISGVKAFYFDGGSGALTIPSTWFYSWSNTSNDATATRDTFLSRGSGAAVIQLGAASAASPVAQTLTFQGSRGGTDTDVAGAAATIKASLGTGAAVPATIALATGIGAGSTGTTQETAINRAIWGGFKSLSNNSTTTFLSCTLAADTTLGVRIDYDIHVDDGASHHQQDEVGTYSCVTVNANSTITGGCTKAANQQTISAAGGTLTLTVTQTNANPSLIQVNSNTGTITPSNIWFHYTVWNGGRQACTPQ